MPETRVYYTIPNQPQLPAEGVYGQLEKLFIAESPPGLWPENQDSNVGQARKHSLLPGEEGLELLTALWNEIFVETSEMYLGMHERTVGLPPNNLNIPLLVRRARVLSRKRKTPFTRTRRRQIVEDFIFATFGDPSLFNPDGLSLLGGIPLYGEAGDISELYIITEFIEDFAYEVWIDPGVDIDQIGLQRELEWFTPAHIAFEIDRTPHL